MKRGWIPNPKGNRRSYDDDPIAEKFRDLLREEFKKRGGSMSNFSRSVGVHIPIMAMWLKDKRASVTITKAVEIWRALGRSLDKDFL